jgi:predicted DCC family thiol-disulfide oxidoreductase YuxK
MLQLHARLEDGTLYRGVAAFAALWRRLPYWRHVARLIALPPVAWVAQFIYTKFATWRFARRTEAVCSRAR